METKTVNPNIFIKRWPCSDWIQPALLVLLSIALLFTGLSIRSLWGSEGRWAEVAREMFLSGNFFLPTINGKVYFDKPLLSYWAILPFSLKGIVTEASSRMPSAISGIGVVLLTFAVGRRLFGNRTAIISALLLLTSAMFVSWSRTASAEILNLFMIWLAFWIFLAGDYGRSLIHTILFYIVGAVAAFCKGPVGPAVIFTSIGFHSTIELLITLREKGLTWNTFREAFSSEFRWISSWKGFLGFIAGLGVFTVLLLMPVVLTGSWQSIQLMWKENVLRFFRPFDHIEPPYIYLKYIPLFFAPWTIFLLASLWEIEKCEPDRLKRWILLTTAAIFIFFTASGSRRSYYILPILPGLAIITGRAIYDWFDEANPVKNRAIHIAALLTSILLLLVGAGLLSAYFFAEIPRHISQTILGGITITGAIMSIRCFFKKKSFQGFIILLILVFVVELWGFTVGMAVAESKRTLRPFSQKVVAHLKDVGDSKIALYQVGDSALIFHLKRGPLRNLSDLEELKAFMKKNPDGFIIANLNFASTSRHDDQNLKGMNPVMFEKPVFSKKDDPLALFAVSDK